MKRVMFVVLIAWTAATAAWLLRRRADHVALEEAGPRAIDAHVVGGTADDAVTRVPAVEGVVRVDGRLHAPGTPAPGERRGRDA